MTHLDDDLAAVLRGLATTVVRSTRQAGLSRSAASVLSRLERGGPQRITRLAAEEAVSQPAMTQLVQRLETAGHLRRTAEPNDRRASRIALTASGVRALESRRAEQDAVVATGLAQLPSDLRHELASALPSLAHLTRLMEDHALA